MIIWKTYLHYGKHGSLSLWFVQVVVQSFHVNPPYQYWFCYTLCVCSLSDEWSLLCSMCCELSWSDSIIHELNYSDSAHGASWLVLIMFHMAWVDWFWVSSTWCELIGSEFVPHGVSWLVLSLFHMVWVDWFWVCSTWRELIGSESVPHGVS